MPRRTPARAELDSRVARTTTTIPMRIFDMAPSRAKPYRVTLDDAERNRKFPCHADQGIAFEIRGPKHRRVGKAQRAHHLSTSHGVSGGRASLCPSYEAC